MNIFDFLTQDELDDLSEDPRIAFSTFVRIAQRRLGEFTRPLANSIEESDWQEIQDARYSYTNIVLAAARRFGTEPFVSMEVPRIKEFDNGTYRQFTADLDHYLTQLAIDNSLRSKSESTTLPQSSKDRIRSYLHHLREAIRNADLTDAKKSALFRKVDDFEATLDKSRINLLAVTILTVEILGIPGTVWGSYDVVSKLIGNINQTFAEAKAVDDEQRKLPITPEPFALAPPRAPSPKRASREFDDEIPF